MNRNELIFRIVGIVAFCFLLAWCDWDQIRETRDQQNYQINCLKLGGTLDNWTKQCQKK